MYENLEWHNHSNPRKLEKVNGMTDSTATNGRKISEMKNLGPACELDLNAVGIRTAGQLIELGAEEAFIRMMIGRKKNGRSTKCCNAAYLYALYGAIHDVDWREVPEAKKSEFKSLTAEMRESGQFK